METVFKDKIFTQHDIDDSDVNWWVAYEVFDKLIEPDLTDSKLQLHHKHENCGGFLRIIYTYKMSDGRLTHQAYCGNCAQMMSSALKHKVDDLGEVTIPFGKHKGMQLSKIPKDYLKWCAENFKEGNLKDRISEYLKSSLV